VLARGRMARGAVVIVAEVAAAVAEQRGALGKGAAPIPEARKAMMVEEGKQPGSGLERQAQELKGAMAREIPILPKADWR